MSTIAGMPSGGQRAGNIKIVKIYELPFTRPICQAVPAMPSRTSRSCTYPIHSNPEQVGSTDIVIPQTTKLCTRKKRYAQDLYKNSPLQPPGYKTRISRVINDRYKKQGAVNQVHAHMHAKQKLPSRSCDILHFHCHCHFQNKLVSLPQM